MDLLPDMNGEELKAELARRLNGRWADTDVVSGLLPEKFGKTVAEWIPAGPRPVEKTAAALAAALKDKRLEVHGTRGWNEAEFTSGGVDAGEIEDGSLESKIVPRLFLAGEICDGLRLHPVATFAYTRDVLLPALAAEASTRLATTKPRPAARMRGVRVMA